MTAKGALAAGRAAHAQLHIDTCVITRVTGRALDPATNLYTDTLTTIYAGPCRLKTANTDAQQAVVGEQSVNARRHALGLPWDAPTPVQVNDVATMTASDDAWSLNIPLTVTAVDLSGSATERRLIVEARA